MFSKFLLSIQIVIMNSLESVFLQGCKLWLDTIRNSDITIIKACSPPQLNAPACMIISISKLICWKLPVRGLVNWRNSACWITIVLDLEKLFYQPWHTDMLPTLKHTLYGPLTAKRIRPLFPDIRGGCGGGGGGEESWGGRVLGADQGGYEVEGHAYGYRLW